MFHWDCFETSEHLRRSSDWSRDLISQDDPTKEIPTIISFIHSAKNSLTYPNGVDVILNTFITDAIAIDPLIDTIHMRKQHVDNGW